MTRQMCQDLVRTLRSSFHVVSRQGYEEFPVDDSEMHVVFSHAENGKPQDASPEENKGGTIANGKRTDSEYDVNGSTSTTKTISVLQAGWNVTNAIQGMFIVSFPYTVVQGGYWALVSMVVFAVVCCYTGKILVACLYETDSSEKKQRVRHTYVQTAQAVMGEKLGSITVNIAQIVELLMTCILYQLLCGELLEGSFPHVPVSLNGWIAISTVPLVGCAALRNLRHVSWLSFWCTVAHMVVNGVIIVYCFTLYHQWQLNAIKVSIDIWTFPISLGIVVFSYTSQIFLPSLEGSMETKERFPVMLDVTHIAAAIFKVLFSFFGFVAFGFGTKEVITNNLPSTLKITANIFLWIKAVCSYPLPYFASVEILEQNVFTGRYLPSCYKGPEAVKPWGWVLRVVLVLFIMAMAMSIPHFTLLMGFIGSFTGTMLSFVWPCFFHLRLKWRHLRWYNVLVDVSVIVTGLLCGVLGIYFSGHALVRAYKGLPVNPVPLCATHECSSRNSTLLP